MKRFPGLRFLLYFLVGGVMLFACFIIYYITVFDDDIFGKNVGSADLFKVILSGGLSFSKSIFLYALVFATVYYVARTGVHQLRWRMALFFLVMSAIGFYLVGYFVPRQTLQNYSMYWAILEEGENGDGRLDVPIELFKNAYNLCSYSSTGKYIDSMEIQKDSAWIRNIERIKYVASPVHIDKLLQEDEFDRLFTKEDFEGITDKGKEDWTNPQVEEMVRAEMENTRMEMKMREEDVWRYRNERTKMLFFPFHVFLFCCLAFLGGTLLQGLNKWLLLLINGLAIGPFALIFQNFFVERRQEDQILSVTPSQWWQLLLEIIILILLYVFYRRKGSANT